MPKKIPKKIILGLVGELAAGKDAVAAYLEKNYGASTISFSAPIREILGSLNLPCTRENMAGIGDSLRALFGQDLFSRVIADQVKKSKAEIIVLPNVRLESDIVYLKKQPGFVLVRIACDDKIRFARLKMRRQNPDDKNKTWKQFQKDAKLYTERHIRHLAKIAKYSLDNNSDKKSLEKQIDRLIKKIK